MEASYYFHEVLVIQERPICGLMSGVCACECVNACESVCTPSEGPACVGHLHTWSLSSRAQILVPRLPWVAPAKT